MIRRIEALHYRCLRVIDQNLGMFQLLVGATATSCSPGHRVSPDN